MREILLIKVQGQPSPEVIPCITKLLSGTQANILDIGHSVIHHSLILAIILEIPTDPKDSAALLHDLRAQIKGLDLQMTLTSLSAQEYEQWVLAQDKAYYCVTLLARVITAEHMALLTQVIMDHGFTIKNVSRLSGRISLQIPLDQQKTCIEFTIRGEPGDMRALRTAILALSQDLNVDIAFQKDNAYRRSRRLIVFDMDSTLIEVEVIDELAKHAGVGDKVAAITEQAMRGEIDFTQSFKRRVALLKGLDETVLQRVAHTLPITEGADLLINALRALGYKTAILSGGFTYFGQYLQKKWAIDYVYANELAIKNGKISGEVIGDVIDGQRKAELLKDIAAREGLNLEQVIAVGDGANDLPMLAMAGLGIAFRAKPVVRESAEHAISALGLDGILYLLGVRDRDLSDIKVASHD